MVLMYVLSSGWWWRRESYDIYFPWYYGVILALAFVIVLIIKVKSKGDD